MLICRIVIYLVDSAVRRFHNQGLHNTYSIWKCLFRIFAKLSQTFPDFQLTLHEFSHFSPALKSMQSSPSLRAGQSWRSKQAARERVRKRASERRSREGQGKRRALPFPAPSTSRLLSRALSREFSRLPQIDSMLTGYFSHDYGNTTDS